MSDFDTYINTIDVIEDYVVDDNKFPVVKDSKMKHIFRLIFQFIKVIFYYLKNTIDATKKEE